MRIALIVFVTLLVAGCGSKKAVAPTATPQPSPTPALGARWKHAPAMTINPNHSYTATVQTSKGTFTIQLLPKVAPIAVNSFVFLARHRYFDGNIFHRVIKNFMIQTGDPSGTGLGGPGYHFKDEPVHAAYSTGTVAMANSGRNTNGSQFFIVVGPMGSQLKPNYTIFGKVASGMNVVEKIASVPVTANPTGELSQPLTDITMKHVTIHESP